MEKESQRRIELLKATEIPKAERERLGISPESTVALEVRNPEVSREYKKVPDNFFGFIRERSKKR